MTLKPKELLTNLEFLFNEDLSLSFVISCCLGRYENSVLTVTQFNIIEWETRISLTDSEAGLDSSKGASFHRKILSTNIVVAGLVGSHKC